MKANEHLPAEQISPRELALYNKLCAKSKRFCALCDRKLGAPTKEQLKEAREAGSKIWCSYVSFRHPLYKSKTYKLCGDCYRWTLEGNDV